MRKNAISRLIVTLLLVLVTLALLYIVFAKFAPGLVDILKDGDEEEIESYLRGQSDVMAYVCMALLQCVQVISVVISGIPIQIAAGVVFGTVRGFFLCHLTSVATNVGVFWFARRMGWSVAETDKTGSRRGGTEKFAFLQNSSHPTYMTFVAFIVPILPNGIIPYVASKTHISIKKFALAAYFGSFMPVLLLCAIGNRILNGGYVGAGVLLLVLVIFAVLLWKLKDQVLDIMHRVLPDVFR